MQVLFSNKPGTYLCHRGGYDRLGFRAEDRTPAQIAFAAQEVAAVAAPVAHEMAAPSVEAEVEQQVVLPVPREVMAVVASPEVAEV